MLQSRARRALAPLTCQTLISLIPTSAAEGEGRRMLCGKLCVRVRGVCTRVCAPARVGGSVCTLACVSGYVPVTLCGS